MEEEEEEEEEEDEEEEEEEEEKEWGLNVQLSASPMEAATSNRWLLGHTEIKQNTPSK